MTTTYKSVRLHFLIENRSETPLLNSEHGLSVLIECDGKTSVLFDTGESGAFLQNAAKLKADLKHIGALVLSHGHYDHTGGLSAFAKTVSGVPTFFHPSAFEERFHHESDGSVESIGMPESARLTLSTGGALQPHPSKDACEVAPGIWFTGEIPRISPPFRGPADDFRLADGSFDPILDDISLYVTTTAGILLICGCAHSGLESILHHVKVFAGNLPIIGIVGGLHLRHASNAELAPLPRLLTNYGVRFVAGCHCTGDQALLWLQENWSGTVLYPTTGTTLEVVDGHARLTSQADKS